MKFSSILALLFALGPATSFAVELGKPLSIRINPSTGPDLLVLYFYDGYLPHPGPNGQEPSMGWRIRGGTDITEQQVSALPEQMRWNILDSSSGKTLLAQWRSVSKMALREMRDDLFRVNAPEEVATLIPNQRSLILVFSADEKTSIDFHLPIGKLCAGYPKLFGDLTKSKSGCDVKASELPTRDADCEASKKEYLAYVADGLLTCEEAKDVFPNKKICGDLSCR